MGHQVSSIFSGLGRFFEYPVKRKPICFYRQEDFTATADTHELHFGALMLTNNAKIKRDISTAVDSIKRDISPSLELNKGEPQKKLTETPKVPMTDYDKLVDQFYKRLAEQRQFNQEMKEKDRRWSMQKVVDRFPGWNEVTIANLHSLFLLFDNQSNGMLGFDDFCAVLESLGDESAMEMRKEKFNAADTDCDGWITYDEFLSLVYEYSPKENNQLSGLALLCNEVADNIQFVSNLTVGEQLEYGLF